MLDGTTSAYWHGKDVVITRKNIEKEQKARAKEKQPLLTPDELVVAFVRIPKRRHFLRAQMLMTHKNNA